MPAVITISSPFQAFNLFGEYFKSGMKLALDIIVSPDYVRILLENIADAAKPSETFVRQFIDSMHICISVIEIGEHMDAYAVVYRDVHPNTIFFNPLLLMQVMMEEMSTDPSGERKRRCSLFIAMKIVHEVSHLVHPHISAQLRNQTLPKSQGGEGKRKRLTPEKMKPPALFQVFGEMVEYDIMGGILELYTSAPQPVAYRVDQLILYAHPASRTGRIVRIADQDYTAHDALASLRLETFSEPVEKKYTGPRGHLGVSVRFSEPATMSESDVISGDENEVAEGLLYDPTF
eukprot:gene33404-40411_t